MAYIYFDYQYQEKQNQFNVLSSLIRQLLDRIPHLPTEIEKLYDGSKRNGIQLTLENLFPALLAIIDSFEKVFFVFDALDEIEGDKNESRINFLSLFHRMGDHGINLFLTSRPHPQDIRVSLCTASTIKLIPSAGDIELYIQNIYQHPRAAHFIEEGKSANMLAPDVLTSDILKCSKGM